MVIDSKKILEQIKESKIKPTPKWHFILKNYSIWTAFAFSVLIGSLSFSVMLYILMDGNWDVYKYVDKSFIEYIILSLPYFWILFISAFIALTYYNYKHTKKGYKYASYLVIVLSIIVSFVFGGTLFAFGLGEKIDQILSHNIPYYQQKIIENKIERWHHPRDGLLIGTMQEAVSDEKIIIKDFENKEWQVKLQEKVPKEILEKRLNEEIRMIGEMQGEDEFNANALKGCRRDCKMRQRMLKNSKIPIPPKPGVMLKENNIKIKLEYKNNDEKEDKKKNNDDN